MTMINEEYEQWQKEGRKLAIEAMCSGQDLEELCKQLNMQCEDLGKKRAEYEQELTDYFELLKAQGKTSVTKDSPEYQKFNFLYNRAMEVAKSHIILQEEHFVLLKKRWLELKAENAETTHLMQQLKEENNFLKVINAIIKRYKGNKGLGL